MNLEWIYGDIDSNYKFGFLLFFIIWTIVIVLAILYVVYKLKDNKFLHFRITKYGKILNILVLLFCYFIVFLQVRVVVLYTGLAYENFDVNADLAGPYVLYGWGDYKYGNRCNSEKAYKLMMLGNARYQQAQDIQKAIEDVTTINTKVVDLNNKMQSNYDNVMKMFKTAIDKIPK
jgi:hypothetical protein